VFQSRTRSLSMDILELQRLSPLFSTNERILLEDQHRFGTIEPGSLKLIQMDA
jgi:hypothetical protein